MKDISKEKYLETLLVISVGLGVVFYFTTKFYFLYASILIGLGGLLSPTLGRGITFLWYKLAAILGYVNSRILLSLLFFIFLVPLAFLSKIFSKQKDPLQLKQKEGESYYVTKNLSYQPKDLENMW